LSKNQQVSRWQAHLLVLAEIIPSTLKMEAIYSSETSVATQQTARRHIPEDDTLHNHRCENLKSYNKSHIYEEECVSVLYIFPHRCTLMSTKFGMMAGDRPGEVSDK
jgi:hypothetical protein